MPQIINTNIASLNAQRNLNNAQSANDTALQRLSSGLRINSAADDAAGMAISTRFDAQISGSNVAIRNAGDGVSLAQTAEGALDSITDSLQRIRELAVQAANGTNSDVDREALNLEAQQLIAEVENVSENANFNGTKLLDGSFEDVRFQTGANATDSINVSINELSTDTLGVAATAGVSSIGGEIVRDTNAGTALSSDPAASALANGDLTINGVAIEASTGSDDSASYADADASAIAKAAAINEKSEETGVTAVALENTVLGQSSGATNGFSTLAGSFDLNGVTVNVAVDQTLDADTNRESIAAAINSVSGQTGVVAINTGDDDTGVSLVAADGRNITLENLTGGASVTSQFGLGGTAPSTATGGTPIYTFTSSVLLQSADGSDIDIAAGTGDLENSGFTEGTKSGQLASLSSTVIEGSGTTGPNAMDAGDLTINGLSIRASDGADDSLSYDDGSATMAAYTDVSAIARAAAINEVSDQTGVSAVVEANVVSGTQGVSAGAAAGAVVVNGVTTASINFTEADEDVRRSEAVDAINAISGRTGVVAVDSGDGIELRADDGRNISMQQLAASAFASVGIEQNSSATGAANEISVFTSTIRLEAAGEFTLGSETGDIGDTGLRAGTYGAEDAGTLLKDVDISTVDGALEAITAIDNALGQVSAMRSDLGATQNRFESTINNLTISSENLSASNSRIRDADYAAETAELSRTQVLIQAGISVLSQANARPQQVLSLLG